MSTVSIGEFWFISSNQYEIDFPDAKILRNSINSDRPYFITHIETCGIYWGVPISSRIPKYKVHYDKIIQKYGKCYTICFEHVLGYKKAFLIQNMIPLTSTYFKTQYVDYNYNPITLSQKSQNNIISNVNNVFTLLEKTNFLFLMIFIC